MRPTPRKNIRAEVELVNIYLFFWASVKCQVQEVLLPACPWLLQLPSRVPRPGWLQHTQEPWLFPWLRTTTHPGGAMLCPQLIPSPCSRGPDLQAPAHLQRHYWKQGNKLVRSGLAQCHPAKPRCIQSSPCQPPDHQTRLLLDSFPHCSLSLKHQDPTKPGTEWPGFETLPGARALQLPGSS